MHLFLSATLIITLAGCGVVDRFRKPPAPVPVATDIATDIVPAVQTSALDSLATGQTAEALDQTSAAEKSVALSSPVAGGEENLGKAVVALGSPAEPGLWLRSALVKAPRKGRVITASGASLLVDLLPGTGAAQLSLGGFQALGLGLTNLPEVTVFGL